MRAMPASRRLTHSSRAVVGRAEGPQQARAAAQAASRALARDHAVDEVGQRVRRLQEVRARASAAPGPAPRSR